MKKLIVPAVVFIGLASATVATRAASWRTCNGSAVKWGGSPDVVRMRFSIPDTGDLNAGYWNGVLQWNDLTSEVGSFLVSDSSGSIDHDNDTNEVFGASRATLDGNNGVTYLSLGACVFSNDIDSADIGVVNNEQSSGMPYTNPDPTSMSNEGRGTFVHEFGHWFGFLDENSGHGAMHQTPRPYTGGGQTASVFPTDTVGLNSLYGLNSASSNLLPSAHQVVSSTTSLLETGIVTACRGSARNIRFYLGNSGKGNSGTYNLRVRLTTSSTGAGGTVAATFTHSLNAFAGGTFTLPFTVPFGIVNGTYFIFVDMDHTGSIGEVREGDNSTRSGQRLSVTCG